MSFSLDIAYLEAGYASGTLTPELVVAEVYRRIAEAGEQPVWITLVDKGAALAKARSAPPGPLYGVPFAVKDNIDVAGLPTTCACPEFAYGPERTATVVARLESAGAILIGKTNMDQFATGLVGTRSPYGIPSSAFNSKFISGGSSSGSAVAVAAGLVSFALGTDTAGSGRVPAAFNNIIGLKPTKGWISASGVVPACRTQDTVSIFALTVGDAARIMRIAACHDAGDAYARRAPQDFMVGEPHKELRIGVPKGRIEFYGDAESEAFYAEAIDRARSLGATISEIDFAPFRDAAGLLYSGPWVAERLAAIKDFAARNSEAIHDVVRGIILGGDKLTAVEAFEGQYALAELARRAEAEWARMDMLLLPTAATTYKICDLLSDPVRLNSNLGSYTNFVNLMDLSALAIPAGFKANGLPFGVSLIGRAFEDGRLAAFGDRLHRSLEGAKLGATSATLSSTPPVEASAAKHETIRVAVIGAHLTGQPLNGQLVERGARLVRSARTSTGYSFYALPGTTPRKPGLVFDGAGAGNIEVEIWELSEEAFGSFVALIPPPLGIGTLKLSDDTLVKGFLCEAHAVCSAEDITAYGGWRAWLTR